jgi:hypothetical protein
MFGYGGWSHLKIIPIMPEPISPMPTLAETQMSKNNFVQTFMHKK